VAIGLRQEWSDSVGPRDREGGSLAARHLLDLGYTRICYVRTSSVEASADRARHAGYAAELRDAGVEPMAPLWWEPGSGTIRVGRRPMPLRDALSGPDAPTAVFVWNDHGAIGLIEAARRPESRSALMSVVGLIISPWPAYGISLTTVAQPLDFQVERRRCSRPHQ
jgi:LacI family transcriptional regulator